MNKMFYLRQNIFDCSKLKGIILIKLKIVILLITAVLIFSGCEPAADIGGKSSLQIETEKSVAMVVKQVSETGIELEITNLGDTTAYYGTWYSLEKNIDGEWFELKFIEGNADITFPAVGYYLDEGSSAKKQIDWEYAYGKLPKGHYRLIKDFEILRNEFYAACEFNIQ